MTNRSRCWIARAALLPYRFHCDPEEERRFGVGAAAFHLSAIEPGLAILHSSTLATSYRQWDLLEIITKPGRHRSRNDGQRVDLACDYVKTRVGFDRAPGTNRGIPAIRKHNGNRGEQFRMKDARRKVQGKYTRYRGTTNDNTQPMANSNWRPLFTFRFYKPAMQSCQL